MDNNKIYKIYKNEDLAYLRKKQLEDLIKKWLIKNYNIKLKENKLLKLIDNLNKLLIKIN